MNNCPNCGMGADGGQFCLECGVRIDPAERDGQDGTDDRALRTKAVYKAPDELSAITLQKVLESQGIPAHIQSIQIPWYDGIMKLVEGYWGKILVFEDQEDSARHVIEDYLKSIGSGLH